MEANGILSAGGTSRRAKLAAIYFRPSYVLGYPPHQDAFASDGDAWASRPARHFVRATGAWPVRLRWLRFRADRQLLFGPRQASNLKCHTPLREYSYGRS